MKASGIPAQYGDKMFSLVTEDSLCCCAAWKQGVVQVSNDSSCRCAEWKEDEYICAVPQSGDLDTVVTLITEMRKRGDVSRYSMTLFECVDMRREDIAIFLIKNGFRSNIWRQVFIDIH